MKNTILKMTIVVSILLIIFTFSKANADESMLKKFENLNENQYILYLPSGDFVLNMDGSPNFDQEQIDETGGEVITVREAKERVTSLTPEKNNIQMDQGVTLFSYPRLNPPRGYTVFNGQRAFETVSGPGWQSSRYFYHPQIGTGGYLLWETFVDSGVVGDTAIYPGSPRYIYSDINRGSYTYGLQYRTYNAPAGTYFTVSNW